MVAAGVADPRRMGVRTAQFSEVPGVHDVLGRFAPFGGESRALTDGEGEGLAFVGVDSELAGGFRSAAAGVLLQEDGQLVEDDAAQRHGVRRQGLVIAGEQRGDGGAVDAGECEPDVPGLIEGAAVHGAPVAAPFRPVETVEHTKASGADGRLGKERVSGMTEFQSSLVGAEFIDSGDERGGGQRWDGCGQAQQVPEVLRHQSRPPRHDPCPYLSRSRSTAVAVCRSIRVSVSPRAGLLPGTGVSGCVHLRGRVAGTGASTSHLLQGWKLGRMLRWSRSGHTRRSSTRTWAANHWAGGK